MNNMNQYFLRAVKNISKYGDTDVFPFPLEKSVFYDCEQDVVALLTQLHNNFDNWLATEPPFNVSQLSPVGYSGFRWVTQLDPLWNAYFLSLVISIGNNIESARIPDAEQKVFSYRFVSESEDNLFNPDIGWHEFHQRSLELANSFNTVAICDISDFYQRARHHRLQNALDKLEGVNNISKKIMDFLKYFSNTNSHGLPIGGPAARLLSELLLNNTDQLLRSEGIQFCRFADDYQLLPLSFIKTQTSLR